MSIFRRCTECGAELRDAWVRRTYEQPGDLPEWCFACVSKSSRIGRWYATPDGGYMPEHPPKDWKVTPEWELPGVEGDDAVAAEERENDRG